VTAQDHNKTLVILHSVIGGIFSLGLIAVPWIVAQNRHREQIPIQLAGLGLVLMVALLFLYTAITMHRREPLGRKCALVAAVVTLPMIWPVGVYTWWFMHSESAKQMYGVKHE
jgi:heme/copper-type cytochrome/quinol oxidase subunit 4